MEKLIEDLKKIQERIEKSDDPTADEDYRMLIDDAHFHVGECIMALNELKKESD